MNAKHSDKSQLRVNIIFFAIFFIYSLKKSPKQQYVAKRYITYGYIKQRFVAKRLRLKITMIKKCKIKKLFKFS
jgi:hypothetical protein